jgi:hypothetical protein
MFAIELIIITVLTGYAVGKQTKVHEVTSRGRFRLTLICAIAGLTLGFAVPHSAPSAGLLAASLIVSVVVGFARGAFTRVWRGEDGRVRSRGGAVTIALFLGLIASKFVLGAVASVLHIHDSSIGEILLMVAVSMAVQAEVVWRRGRVLGAGSRQATGEAVELT